MRHFRDAAIVCAMLCAAACSHATQSSSPQTHTAQKRHAIITLRSATPPPVPTPPPPQTPPRALPRAVVEHVVRLPSNAAPQILAVAMSETTIHHGDRVSGSVITTSNVASVQARVGVYGITLNKVGVGHFALTFTANLPWFVRGNFELHVIATNTAGAAAQRVIPLTVR